MYFQVSLKHLQYHAPPGFLAPKVRIYIGAKDATASYSLKCDKNLKNPKIPKSQKYQNLKNTKISKTKYLKNLKISKSQKYQKYQSVEYFP